MPITMAPMMAANASNLGRCHTRGFILKRTIHASKVHVDKEPRDVSGTLSKVCLLNG
jgi:hypothetical protein